MIQAAHGAPLLALRRIACVRGERLLFEGLDLALPAGGAAVVTGANGAGKSSLLRIAAGLLRPAAGQVERPARVALDSERVALDPRAPLAAALGFWARLDCGRGGQAAAVTRGLEALDLRALRDVPVRLLSTGQRRRAGLARLVASGAPVWLLDEPGNGLDAQALARLSALLAAHRAGGGVVVAATHTPLDLPQARAIRL